MKWIHLTVNPFNPQRLLYIPPGLTFTDSTFCLRCVFMTLYESQIVTVSLYSINCLVFCKREGMCLLSGTDWIFRYNAGQFSSLKCKCMCRCILIVISLASSPKQRDGYRPNLVWGYNLKAVWSQFVCYLNKDRPTWCHLLYYITIYCSTCFEC